MFVGSGLGARFCEQSERGCLKFLVAAASHSAINRCTCVLFVPFGCECVQYLDFALQRRTFATSCLLARRIEPLTSCCACCCSVFDSRVVVPQKEKTNVHKHYRSVSSARGKGRVGSGRGLTPPAPGPRFSEQRS